LRLEADLPDADFQQSDTNKLQANPSTCRLVYGMLWGVLLS